MRRSRVPAISILLAALVFTAHSSCALSDRTGAADGLEQRAKTALASHSGEVALPGLSGKVEVLRDSWGIPHIYAGNTADLFFAQGFVVAQDRMWQLEMWRRNGEGKLAEVLGPAYVTRDTFARLLAFRGDWEEEYASYHPEGRVILEAFSAGINTAIRQARTERRVPIEFELSGFDPEPVWTTKTIVTRMSAWSMSRNASSEVSRAIDVRTMGTEKVEELRPTEPPKKLHVPDGLDLGDIVPEILDIARNANNIRWELAGSNNWVIGGEKSVTGMPLLANDPHREIVTPSLRYYVHLVAPGWNVMGAGDPALPGISIGHNEQVAWGFTILGVDQQDIYVEETHPESPNRYLHKGRWLDMRVERDTIHVKGGSPVEIELKFTRHGPVLYEDTGRRRAYALRWAGAEPGGAGYLGALGVLQARNWSEFNAALGRSWRLPSHSLVYADVDGNIGYVAAALAPSRRGWDGLLPVPGRDGRYEWDGFLPPDLMPRSLNSPAGFYNTSNNDVVPKIVPGYEIPLGYEYAAPWRYDRVTEVLREPRRFSVADMEKLQQDTLSLPARQMVPLLRGLSPADQRVRAAIATLLEWDFRLDADSTAASIYQFWMLKLAPLVYAPRLTEGSRGFRQYNTARVVEWMRNPDAAYGETATARDATRDRMLLTALEQALEELASRLGAEQSGWKWGDLHTADFTHPLGRQAAASRLFHLPPVRRGGDGNTVMATSNLTASSSRQAHGASVMFVLDAGEWDRSTGLNVPGASGQPLGPHHADLIPHWSEARYFPLVFSRSAVETNTKNRLVLQPAVK
jgi:penicillin G amidase